MKSKKKKNKYLLRLKNKLKEEKGISITTIGFGKIMLLMFIFYLITTTMSIIYLLTNSRNLVEYATVETVQRNYAKVYHTSRESYSGGYRPSGAEFYETYINDKVSIIKNLLKNDKMKLDEENLTKVSKNGQLLYKIKDIKVNVNNEPIRSGTQKFIITTMYTFEYPVEIFGKSYNLEIPMKVQAKHTGKF